MPEDIAFILSKMEADLYKYGWTETAFQLHFSRFACEDYFVSFAQWRSRLRTREVYVSKITSYPFTSMLFKIVPRINILL